MELCGELHPQKVFDHYAYGDPLPVYARYVAEGEPSHYDEAITIYVACQREKGHQGKHLATTNRGWTEAVEHSEGDA